MISLILWSIAPIFNAIMDLVEAEPFYQSIFFKAPNSTNSNVETVTKWNNWWYKRISWAYAKKIFGYKIDAWHISKSLMIIFIVASAILFHFEEMLFNTKFLWINISLEVVIRGLSWNTIFSLFYHKLFRSKTWQK